MALGKRRKRSQKFIPPKLMLTSMMDMFTIILIFLLFSFSESPETLHLDKDLELPHSTTEQSYRKTVKLVLSKKELRLNDEVLATVYHHEIIGLNAGDLKSSALFQRLKITRAQQTTAVAGQESQPAPHVLFLCDKSYSFKTINKVIKAAAMAGYPNFQFAVVEKDN